MEWNVILDCILSLKILHKYDKNSQKVTIASYVNL